MGKQQIHEALSTAGYRLTSQRRLIINVILSQRDRHLSVDEIYRLVVARSPDTGIATVYRTVDLLKELAILQEMNFGDGRSRYELASDVHQHHHLICEGCGKVTEFEKDLLELLERRVSQESRFQVKDHQVKFFGLCADCQAHLS